MSYTKSFSYFTSPLKRGSMFYLGFFGVVGMVLPFMNLYFRQELGFSGRQIGILAVFPPLMTLLIGIPVASLADRRRWRVPLLTGAVIGFGLVLVLCVFPHTFIAWAALRLAMALFIGPLLPLADSLIARMSIRHHLNYGSMRLWGSIGFALSAVGGGVLWEQIGFGAMFIIAGVSLLPVLLFASRLEEGPIDIEQQVRPSLGEMRQDLGLVVLVVASFLVGASVHASVVFDGIYMNSLGGTQLFVGLMFGLAAFSELPTMRYREVIARHFGGPNTLLLAYGLLITAFLGYTLVWQPWMLFLTVTIKGLGFGLFFVSTVRLTSERTPESWASTVQSVITASAFGLAPLIATPLGGELYDRFGPKAVFLGGTLSVVGAALVLSVAIIGGVFAENKLENRGYS
jgi:PPP family 3-phenylpropionic acid transporter